MSTRSAEPPSGLDPDRVYKALPANLETMSVDALVDEMLERLNDHDYVGTLVLAELIRLKSPEQGVAVVCRKEVLQILAPCSKRRS